MVAREKGKKQGEGETGAKTKKQKAARKDATFEASLTYEELLALIHYHKGEEEVAREKRHYINAYDHSYRIREIKDYIKRRTK